jgi:hypothetical protein
VGAKKTSVRGQVELEVTHLPTMLRPVKAQVAVSNGGARPQITYLPIRKHSSLAPPVYVPEGVPPAAASAQPPPAYAPQPAPQPTPQPAPQPAPAPAANLDFAAIHGVMAKLDRRRCGPLPSLVPKNGLQT